MGVPQPTPNATRADVERIVRRDFPPEQFQAVVAILDEYGREEFHIEIDRVHLAVLKLSAGSMDALRRHIEWAKCDWRDVLGPAEYPGYSKKMFRIDRLTDEEQRKIIERDWKQYETWLSKA
jgi:hypothetical protein